MMENKQGTPNKKEGLEKNSEVNKQRGYVSLVLKRILCKNLEFMCSYFTNMERSYNLRRGLGVSLPHAKLSENYGINSSHFWGCLLLNSPPITLKKANK